MAPSEVARTVRGSQGPWRTNAGPMRTGVRGLSTAQGVRLDGHLLRGGAATRTVDHCTSPPFVPDYRTRWLRGAQAEIASSGRGGRGSRIEQLDGLVESRVLAGSEVRRRGHDDIPGDPDVVDPGLVRRQPLCDRQLQRARLRQL